MLSHFVIAIVMRLWEHRPYLKGRQIANRPSPAVSLHNSISVFSVTSDYISHFKCRVEASTAPAPVVIGIKWLLGYWWPMITSFPVQVQKMKLVLMDVSSNLL